MIKWYDRIGNKIEMKLYENADKPDFFVGGKIIPKFFQFLFHILSLLCLR